MKTSKFTDSLIMSILKQAESGTPPQPLTIIMALKTAV